MDASDYAQFRPLMFSIAYRMTGSVADAEDIVQEAVTAATWARERSPRRCSAVTRSPR